MQDTAAAPTQPALTPTQPAPTQQTVNATTSPKSVYVAGVFIAIALAFSICVAAAGLGNNSNAWFVLFMDISILVAMIALCMYWVKSMAEQRVFVLVIYGVCAALALAAVVLESLRITGVI